VKGLGVDAMPAIMDGVEPLLALDDEGSGESSFDAPGSPKHAPEASASAVAPRAKRRKREVTDSPSASSAKSSSSSSFPGAASDRSDSFDGVSDGGGERSRISEWVRMEDGPRFKVDTYKPRSKKRYIRLVVECSHHDSCSKKRSVSEKQTENYGELEVVAHLLAWEEMGGVLTKAEHMDRRLRVAFADVTRHANDVGERSDLVCDLIHNYK
jgi:hypothetical protein